MSKEETRTTAQNLANVLRHESGSATFKCSTAHMAANELERLDAEIKALRADGDRYRWLFGARTAEELEGLTADSGPPPDKPQDYVLCELMANYVTKAYADAMIDGARAAQAAAKESP